MIIKKQQIFGLLIFAIGFALGWIVVSHSWNGMVYVYVNGEDGRTPSALNKKFDLSNLKGTALIDASKERLIEQAKIVKDEDDLGIQLGHFFIKGDNGQKKMACSQYDQIELIFMADNVSVSGSRPTLKVKGNCQLSEESIESIKPIWIPIKKVQNEKPGNVILSYWEKGKVTLTFSNIGNEWPSDWSLKEVKLYKENEFNGLMSIGSKDINRIRKSQSLSMDWKEY